MIGANETITNEPIGHVMTVPKDPTTSRIYGLNLNGIDIKQCGGWHEVCQNVKALDIDFISINEHKVDTTKQYVRERLHKDATDAFGTRRDYRLQAHSTPVRAAKCWKPGGVLQLTTGKHQSWIMDHGKDEFGRWVYTTFRCKGATPRTIITTYQVVDTNPYTSGPTTYATQLFGLYTKSGRDEPHKLRKHHARDLIDFIHHLHSQEHSVIVQGDFNEVLGESPDGFTKLCSECHLVDPITTIHGPQDFATYNRGHKVLDYILVDEELLPSIVRCGYEPFNSNFFSDHRGVYIDVDTDMFFGDQVQLAAMQSRDLVSTKQYQIAPYFKHKHQHLEDHNWFEKIQTLRQCIKDENPNHPLAEELYGRLLESCRYAGKRLPKFRDAPYSPELVRLRKINNYLSSVQTQLATGIDMAEQLAKQRRKLGTLQFDLPTSVEACKLAKRQAQKDFKIALKQEIKKRPLRKAHMKQLIKAAKAEGDMKKARLLKHIKRTEESNDVFHKLRNIRNKVPSGGLKHLLVPEDPTMDPKQCTDWRTVDIPHEIEALLQERNQKHFGQSRDCNLTSPPTDFTMDFTGTCHRAEQILDGTYPMEDVDELTKIFLEALQYVSAEDKDFISPKLTSEEYLGKVKVWNERTSTSPGSNQHLGHLKAYTAQHSLEDKSQAAEELQDQRDAILGGHLTLLNYALHFGYSYDPWKTIVNAMLEKQPGIPKIHRLRVIHLMEADYNLILSVKWRALLQHACNKGYVNEHQFGSQPGKEALDAVFIRELEYELTRLTRSNLLHFDNDATSCYDRIPCFLANVVSRKYGMHRKVCVVQGKTLAEARYHLKTQLGVSDEFVQHSRAFPWFGTGQGSGNSPCYWLFICSTLFDIYESKAKGATYESPDKLLTTTIKIVGFVDDTRNSTNTFGQSPQPSMESLVAQAQQDSQLWNNLLLTCNQQLELPKCGFHPMTTTFDENGAPIMEEDPNISDLVLHREGEPQDNGIKIDQWKTTEATKYLGCHVCPNNNKPQLEVLKKKCQEFCRIVTSSHLTQREANVLYWSIYRPSVGYPLPMCHFTRKELDKVQQKVESAFTVKMGYNRSTPKAVLRGPKYLGGVGMFHLYDEQGYGQCRHFLKSWRSPDSPQGKLLHITVAWLQFCAGVDWSILGNPQIPLKHHLESKWLLSLHEYLNSIEAKLEIQNPYIPKPQRANDKAIMSVVVQAKFQTGKQAGQPLFTPAQIKRINYCRMYLNVVFLSDVCNAAGTAIDPAMLTGDFDATMSKCNHHRVNQARPGDLAWDDWRRALHMFCTSPYTAVKTLKPECQLSDWLYPVGELRRQWPVLYDPGTDDNIANSDFVYCKTPEGWTKHACMWIDYDDEPITTVAQPPITAAPCDFAITPLGTIKMNGYENIVIPEVATQHTSITSLIPTLDDWEQHLLKDLELLTSEADIWNCLTHRQCFLVSDGSAPDGKGSFAWVLSTPDGRRLAQCSGPTFGYKLNSYRAEGYGMLSGFRFLYHMQQLHFTGTPLKRHRLFCDNKSMVEMVVKYSKFDKVFPNSTLSSEWDIIAEIRQTLRQLQPLHPIPKIRHVKGHQDDNKPYEELDLSAQLNVDADKLADDWLTSHPEFDHGKAPLLPTSGCHINLPYGTITHNLKHELKLARSVPDHTNYLMEKYSWEQSTFDDIDWVCHGRALNRMGSHRTSLTKYLIGWHPVGTRVHRYDPKYPACCASCGHLEEDRDHVLRCPNRQQDRDNWVKEVKTYLDKNNTHPMLHQLLMDQLQALLNGEDTDMIPSDDTVVDLDNAQYIIGWEQILLGRFSKAWTQTQDAHLHANNLKTTRKNGQAWLTGLIQVILQQWWHLWESRNEDRHGRDAQTKAQAANRQAIHELDVIYNKYTIDLIPSLLLPKDRWLLSVPFHTRAIWPTHAIRQWINTWEPVLQESYKTQLEVG